MDEFEIIYENMDEFGEIIDNNGVLIFNFLDFEGNYFVIGKVELFVWIKRRKNSGFNGKVRRLFEVLVSKI